MIAEPIERTVGHYSCDNLVGDAIADTVPYALAPLPYEPASRYGTGSDFPRILSRFDPITLAEMDAVALLDRTDTKYVLGAGQLATALAALPAHYRVLDIQRKRLNRYCTLYFDSDDFALYHSHHAGKRVRCKVRSRLYVDTGLAFLEVKWRAKRDHTVKSRTRTADFVTRWDGDAECRLGAALPAGLPLGPKVMIEFYRVTLVGKSHRERVTLDLGLRFQGNGRAVALPGVAIAEVKQSGIDRASAFMKQMRAAGIRPSGFSKYCVGTALLYQELKHNRFKPVLRLVSELMGGDTHAR